MTAPATSAPQGVAPNEYRYVIGHFASGVTVVTSRHDGKPHGTTASAVTSVSLEPPMLLISMNGTSATGRAIDVSGRFAVNILTTDQTDAAIRFASKAADKFAGFPIRTGIRDTPLLAHALATCECRVVERVTGGTHTVFLAEVERATAQGGAPLAYFRGQFGRLEVTQDEDECREIRARVLSGQLGAGAPLDVESLAEEAGVARGAVYHALAKLRGDGLVSNDPDGRFKVAPLTLEVVEERLRARSAIELGAAQITVGRVPDERLRELRELIARSRPADPPLFDMNAHLSRYADVADGFVRLADSLALSDAYRRVNAPSMITSIASTSASPRRAAQRAAVDAYGHHMELLAAHEAADLDAAMAAIHRHIRQTIAYVKRHLDAVGGHIYEGGRARQLRPAIANGRPLG